MLILIKRRAFYLLDIDTTEEQQGATTNAMHRFSKPLTFITPGPVICARLSYDRRFLVLQRTEVDVDIYDLIEKAELRMKVKSRSKSSNNTSSPSKGKAKKQKKKFGILRGGIRWCQFSPTSHALVLITYEGLDLYHLEASVITNKSKAKPVMRRPSQMQIPIASDSASGKLGVKATTCRHMDTVEKDSNIAFHCFFPLQRNKTSSKSAIIALGCDPGHRSGRRTLIKPYRVTKDFRFELLSSFMIPASPHIRTRCIKFVCLYQHIFCVHMQEHVLKQTGSAPSSRDSTQRKPSVNEKGTPVSLQSCVSLREYPYCTTCTLPRLRACQAKRLRPDQKLYAK